MTDVRASASAPGGTIAGVYNTGATVQMAQVVAVGSGGGGTATASSTTPRPTS